MGDSKAAMTSQNPTQKPPRGRNLAFVVIFFLILLVPAFVKLPPPADFRETSGKFLSSRPFLDAYWFFTRLPGQYQDYFAEHFFLRDQGVALHNEIVRQLGGTVFQDVLIGQKGWLYLTDEDNLGYYQCDRPFSDAQVARLVERVGGMRDFTNSHGADFVLLIAPNKESIYPEFLPRGLGTSGKPCRMDQALQALQSAGIPALDLREPLEAGKGSGLVYFQTDTHWNDAGAFIAYRALTEQLAGSFSADSAWAESDFQHVQESKSGDLAGLIPLFQPITEEVSRWDPLRQRAAIVRQGEDKSTIISESGITSNPNAVVFRDSFFMQLLPFFAESFNRAVYRWSFDFDRELIENEKPEIVIYELAERYLSNLAR